MAFQSYPFGIAEIYRGNVDLLADSIRILSVRTGYTFDGNDQTLADITSTLRDAHAAVVLTSPAIADADAAFSVATPVTIPAGSGSQCNAFLIYKHTGTDNTSTLLFYLSGAQYTYTPSGLSHSLEWAGYIASFAPISGFYDKGMADIARTTIDLLTADIRAFLVDEADYTFSAAHEDLADVAAGARVGTPVALGSKTISDAGVFDSASVVLTAVTGDATEAAIIYLHTGVEATSTLIGYYTNAELDVTPNGNDITILTPTGWISQ